MPGPLSSTATTKRPSPLVSSPEASNPRSRTSMEISGRMPASSQASSELSTASLMVVSSAFDGLSKPSRCRFLVKNSEMEISRCRVAISSAVERRFGRRGSEAGTGTGASGASSARALPATAGFATAGFAGAGADSATSSSCLDPRSAFAGFADFATFAAIPASDIDRIRVYHGPGFGANSSTPFGNSLPGGYRSV